MSSSLDLVTQILCIHTKVTKVSLQISKIFITWLTHYHTKEIHFRLSRRPYRELRCVTNFHSLDFLRGLLRILSILKWQQSVYEIVITKSAWKVGEQSRPLAKFYNVLSHATTAVYIVDSVRLD